MTDMIEVTVRVPADLKVDRSEPNWVRLSHGKWSCSYEINDTNWHSGTLKAIAAAIEARKPRPPKFQVGDVVEWEWEGRKNAAVINRVETDAPGGLEYWANGDMYCLRPDCVKLVRGAEK